MRYGRAAHAGLWVALACAVALAAPEDRKDGGVATALESVTVYEDRALVSRTAEVQRPAGASVVRLKGFPAALVEASLRASVEGAGAKVISVATRTERRAEAVREDVRKAEERVDSLERDRLRSQAHVQALALEKAQLDAFDKLARRAIAERATMGEPDVEAFRKAAALFPKRQKALAATRRDADVEIEKLDEKLKDARAAYKKIASRQSKTVRTVEVSLEAAQAGPASVTVSYIVRDCGWSPRYEARLAGGKLRVAYQGEVRQKTGEDWKDVRMALSTARPALGAKRPKLARMRMRTQAGAKAERRVRSRGVIMVAAMPAPDEAAGEEVAHDRAAPSLTRAEDTGLSVLFQVPDRVTVPGDGRAHKVPVMAFTDAAPALCFETVPKLARYVYLRCDTNNKTAYPMLAGPVDIWRESGFIGTSRMKFTPPRGKLALSLGIDEDLKVRRVAEEVSTKKATLGGKRVRTFTYRIEVANNHNRAETVRVRENYPVSDVEEVRARLTDKTTTPKEHDEKQGLLMWELEIAPEKKQSVLLDYQVTLPKDFEWKE